MGGLLVYAVDNVLSDGCTKIVHSTLGSGYTGLGESNKDEFK